MIQSADPTEPCAIAVPPGRGLGLAAGILALLLVTGPLGACSTVSGTISDVFGSGDAEAESTVQAPAEAEGEQPFPNLGTVPGEAPETSSAEERAAITEGLAADRANAEYTDEPLAPAVASAPPPAAPAPAEPPPAPAAAPAASAQPAIESQPVAPPPQPAQSAPPPAPQVTQVPSPPAPAASAAPAQPLPGPPLPGQPEVLAGGSVTVNPDAVLGDGGGSTAASRLLPSGESRPVALIFFRYGSAGLSRGDIAVLKDVARLHQERGGLVRVIGHASQGSATGDVAKQNMANLNISLARANAVARELSRLGVPTDQIQVAAAGAQQPLYYETQATGEAGNRRVEIYLDY